jgi:hypothetical protein
VASFRKRNSISIQLEVDGKHLIEPCDVDEFSKHFQSVYNNSCLAVFPTLSSFGELLSVAAAPDTDVLTAVKLLKPSKPVGVDDIPGFIIKRCTHIFPIPRKQAAIHPVLKKATVSLLAIADHYPFSIIFPNYLNMLFMTMFRIIYSLKLVFISTASINLNLPSPIW